MVVKFIDCDFSNAGIDGVFLGENSKAEFINTTTNNNGRNGVTLGAGSDATFIRHVANNNGAYGVFEITEASLEQLCLPNETDIDKLKDLLIKLIETEDEKKEAIVQSSFLSDFLADHANSTTIIANLILFAQTLQLIP